MGGIDALTGGLVDWVRSQPGIALLLCVAVQISTFVVAFLGWSRSAKLARRQSRMLRGASGESLERMLLDYASGVEETRVRLNENANVSAANTQALRSAVRRIGLIRYDAFDQVGGYQSFSLALLDERGSGIVLSSLVSRHDSRIYVKAIAGGASDQPLTPEEARAVAEARVVSGGSGGRDGNS